MTPFIIDEVIKFTQNELYDVLKLAINLVLWAMGGGMGGGGDGGGGGMGGGGGQEILLSHNL